MILNKEQQTQLANAGWIKIEQAATATEVAALADYLEQLWVQEGELAGSENYQEKHTRRLANLADKGAIFRRYFNHPLVIAACHAVMGDSVRVSMLNARDALPNSGARQLWHCDTDNSGLPDATGYYACTAIWMIDDFSAENGATYLVPETHKSGKVPKMVMQDRYAPHPDEMRATGNAGDLFIFNGHCWHAGGANLSDRSRRALLVHYLRADWLPERADRRQHISAETLATLTHAERTLLGCED